jgi:hypothetical protein
MMAERSLLDAFVAVTDDLVGCTDIGAYLGRVAVRAAQLLDVRAVAVLFARDGALDVAASSGELGERIGRCEISLGEGPSAEALRSGAPVECRTLFVAEHRWPRFAPAAMDAGLAAVHAMPCLSRDDVLGALAMYASRTGAPSLELGRAMASAISLGVTVFRERAQAVLADQLQHALHSRVVIEQAKGMLAERLELPISEAFELLRRHARSNNVKVHDVARNVLDGTLVLTGSPATPPAARTPRTPPPLPAG